MPKFRINHKKKSKKANINAFIKIGFILLLFISYGLKKYYSETPELKDSEDFVNVDESNSIGSEEFWPNCIGELVDHEYYYLCYNEKTEQANWVAYNLNRQNLMNGNEKRWKKFNPDPKVSTRSAVHKDYTGSGYDRGHLVPAADMKFNRKAMRESFYMSNICPQKHLFNSGIWRDLEMHTRIWAKKFNNLYVVSGPIFSKSDKLKIGMNRVGVPSSFFKVLLDISEPELKGIAFILPNEVNDLPLMDFAVSIDRVEMETGIDFFDKMKNQGLIESLEARFNPKLWKINKKIYRDRVEDWNTRKR